MKKYFKKGIILLLCLGVAVPVFSNGLNLNGMGSKAIAMGGAFIGLADDYSAVYWNPAGLSFIQKSTLGLFVTDIIPNGSYKLAVYNIDAQAESKHYFSGSASFFTPITNNLVVGLGIYVPSGVGAKWNGEELNALSGGQALNWESYLGIITIAPAISYKINETLSIGATFNINYGFMELHKPSALGQYEEDLSGTSFNATFGILFKPSEIISFGLSYKPAYTATLKGTATMPGAALLQFPASDDAERKAEMPMWIGFGIAFKPIEALTVTADLQYTNWGNLKEIPIAYSHAGWKAAFEQDSAIELNWKDAIQFRFGLEYRLSKCFALRGGYYYDPNPSPQETQIILLPQFTYNWITLGFGYKTDKISLDFAIEYAMGQENDIGLTEGAEMPGLHNMTILVPTIAFTYKF